MPRMIDRTCRHCNASFQARWDYVEKRGVGNYCSKSCSATHSQKDKKKGYQRPDGYRVIYVDGRWTREHRHLMEVAIGRPLRANEHVHHRNGIRSDNRLENLELLSASEHSSHHAKPRAREMNRIGNLKRWGPWPKPCTVDGCLRHMEARGLCEMHYAREKRRRKKAEADECPK